MITIKSKLPRTQIFTLIEQTIKKGMPEAAQLIAGVGAAKMREVVPVKTGNLRNAITILPGSAKTGFGRTDIVIDVKKAPYAIWIEAGANAAMGIPYSKKGSKDYSKSKYKGVGYIKQGIDFMSNKQVYGTIIRNTIIKSIQSVKSV